MSDAEAVPGPATLAAATEDATLPPGNGDRFAGYGVMGLPFTSGHVLAMRRFPASSLGPGYTSVWHRTPTGRWTFWQDQPDEQSCAHYFADSDSTTRRVEVALSWPAQTTLRVEVPAVGLEWTATLDTTAVTRALNTVGRVMPDRAWHARPVLRVMGAVAGPTLRAGRLSMVGTSPSGHDFVANPMQVWVIDRSHATLAGEDLGVPGALHDQARLGDFWIPQRGVFALGRAFFSGSP